MVSGKIRSVRATLGLALVSAAVVVAGCGSGGVPPGQSSSSTTSQGKAKKGGTVSFALPPGNPPNMIFPFFSAQYVGNANTNDFMSLMYRPLYWEDGPTFHINTAKSLAYLPRYNASRTAVTIRMKRWRWSDGEQVSPKNVAFFMGILAKEIDNWWGYVPSLFPQNVSSVSYDDAANSFTLHLTHPVNTDWFTNNQLTLIQPLPEAWNLTGPGKKANCSDESKAAESSCAAVYNYLEKQAKSTSNYDTNKLWQVVDGPFHLKTFSPGGSSVVLVPNPKYSGTDKPQISEFKLESFTSDQAEYNVLRSGGSLTVGYVPYQDVPKKPSGASAGPNPVDGYSLHPWFNWADSPIAFNYENPSMKAIFNQHYFRQAMQHLVDQQSIVENAFNGYAYTLYGTVPSSPPNPYATEYEKSNPFPYDPSKARALLTAHGWTISGNGPATCTKPGTAADECGAGIAKGRQLNLSIVYSSGIASVSTEMEAYQSAARQIGVQISLKTLPVNSLFAMDGPCTKSGGPTCTWDMLFWGGPVSMQPFWWPENGLGFICGAFANTGGYCNKTLDAMYPAVYRNQGLKALHAVQNFVIRDNAQVYTPLMDAQLTEVANDLGGFTQSGTMAIEPEDWYLTSGS